MAKSKLTKQAIKFLVEMYEHETENYTYQDIADMIKTQFGISVSVQAVMLSYHKHKDNFSTTTGTDIKAASANIKTDDTAIKPKTVFERQDKTQVKTAGFSEDSNSLSKTDVDSLFKKSDL